jgi:hypothetical protein
LRLEPEQTLFVARLHQLCTSPAAVVKATDSPRWQAARPSARQTCVLPVPLLPRAMMLSRATTYSQRASSRTSGLLERWDRGEVECVEAFHRREARGADTPLDHASFAVDEFEFDEA